MKSWVKLLPITLSLVGCKKPFTPSYTPADNNRYLVVEGVINGSNDSTFIKLSRTKKIDTSKTITPETNAIVTVENDGNNGTVPLTEIVAGTYAAPPINLDVSHKYRLRIITTDNKTYLSAFVPVKNSPPIDSVGFNAKPDGVQIYANAHDNTNTTRYYRWEYREDWQFHTQYNSSIKVGGGSRLPSEQVYNCFAKDVSSNIVIASTTKLATDVVYQQPITFVPGNSEKIETKYSILVKQYVLTSDAYDFWDNLQKNTEKIGSIFDVQPSDAESNYYCASNPNELVIGYLSVGSVATRRVFITASQLLPGYSPLYPSPGPCELDTFYFVNPTPGHMPDLSNPNTGYRAVQALYCVPEPPQIPNGPCAVTYSTTICVDCTIRGTTQTPPFWR